MTFSSRYAIALAGAMGLVMAADAAQAIDLNGKGSSAGRNFASDTPSKVCDAAGPATFSFQRQAAPLNPGDDPNFPSDRTEWICNVSGVGSVTFRYHSRNSLTGFSAMNNTSVTLNTEGYLSNPSTNCGLWAGGTNPTTFNGVANVTIRECSASPALVTNLPVHYGATDTAGSDFTQSGFGGGVNPPVFAAGVDLTKLEVIVLPFGIAVGSAVNQPTPSGLPAPACTVAPCKLDSLSTSDLYNIFGGSIQDWTTIGNTVTPVAGETSKMTVCHRTPGSGTLATLDQTIMKKGPIPINGVTTAPVLGNYGNVGNASSSDVLNCMNGISNPNFRVSIGYVDSDSLPLLATGSHFVKINGYNVFDPNVAVPLPADESTSTRLRDVRCGDYPYWSKWSLVVRTNGLDGVSIVGGGTVPAGTDTLLDKYITAAQTNNPNIGFWVKLSDMFVDKNDTQGPQAMKAGGETYCQKAN